MRFFMAISSKGAEELLLPVVEQLTSAYKDSTFITDQSFLVELWQDRAGISISRGDLAEAEILVLIGGDGFILSYLVREELSIPILTINGGKRGALCFFEADAPISFTKNNHQRIDRYYFALYREGQIIKRSLFINEIVIFRKNRMISLNVQLANYCKDIHGDGVVVASRVGSTAYNFAAKGAILLVDALIINPLASNTFFTSLVTDQEIAIVVNDKNTPVSLNVDGQSTIDLLAQDKVVIGKYDQLCMIKNREYDHFSKLMDKLEYDRRTY